VHAELRQRGHKVTTGPEWTWKVGGMQGVAIDGKTGVLTGGCDPRRDGYVVPA
jgi:gamma-glutamyltranspeptidase/glutathione hydrolase